MKNIVVCAMISKNGTREGDFVKKQPQVTEQTKLNLREAFWDLYVKKPIDKISIKEVTDLAGYNRGTFYLYYKDVYDMFSQIEDEILDKIQEVIQDSILKNETFDLSQQMGVLVELMQTHSHYATVLLSDQGDPRFASRLKEIIWPLLTRYFVSSEGHSEYQMALLSEFYLSGILAVVAKWISDPKMTIDQFIDFMIPNVFHGNYHGEKV